MHGLSSSALDVASLSPRFLFPLSLFLAGVAVVAIAVATGEAEVSLFLIFPVFSGSSGLFLLGVAIIALAMLAGFVAMAVGQPELAQPGGLASRTGKAGIETREKSRFGGVVLVGPIPIAFGSDRKMALAMIAIAVAAAAVVLLLILLQ